MAEIKVRITGDNADFKKKLAEASAESRLMAREMHEQFSKVKETVIDLAGETGLGKVAQMLGAGGLGGAAVAFGAALVEAVKGGIEKAMEFEDIMAKIGGVAGSEFAGKRAKEFIETMSTVGPSKEQKAAAWFQLQRGGMTAEEIEQNLPRLQKLSVGTGESIVDLAEKFAKGEVGIPRGLQKDLDIRAAAERYGPGHSSLELLRLMTDPGGAFFNSLTTEGNTLKGSMQKLAAATDKPKEEIGEALLPSLKTNVQIATAVIPTLTKAAVEAVGMASGAMWLDMPKLWQANPEGSAHLSNPGLLTQAQQNEQKKKENLDREHMLQDLWKKILEIW